MGLSRRRKRRTKSTSRPSAVFTREIPSKENIIDVDAPTPDPQIGAASKEAIQLGRDQFAAQQALLAKFSPLYEEQIRLSQEAQAKNTARSDAQWQQYTDTFKPLEEKMAATVAGYDTQERRDKAAADAMAGVTGTFDQARQGLTESLNQQGIGSSSGKGLALRNALGIEEAKAKAGAGANAIRNVESTGLSLLGSATNFGRGLTNTGLQTGQAAQSNGNNATGQVSGLSGLTGAGFQAAQQGLQTGIGGLTNYYNAQANATSQQNGIFGDILGAGMTAAGMFMSSEKLKDMGAEVDGKAAVKTVSMSPAKHWAYKPGLGDGNVKPRMGPTAESLEGTPVSDGEKMDGIAMLGLHHAAIGQTSKDIKALTREVKGLAALVRKDGAKPKLLERA